MLLFFFHHAHQWMAVQVNDEHYLRRALGNVIGTAKADALRLTSSFNYPNLAATQSDGIRLLLTSSSHLDPLAQTDQLFSYSRFQSTLTQPNSACPRTGP
mmetsp:Transcript_35741/g.62726  ORF Transcript_35741/g.62726 Transcript_35741/m.62726 type:complete len:100 (-) Transcript_35741:1387-1686(-)